MTTSSDVLVQSRRVLLRAPGERARVVPAALLLRGGRILQVCEPGAAAPPGVEVLDYGESLITPAFVNPHTHLAMNCMRGRFLDLTASDNAVEQLFFRIESLLEPGDVRAFTRMGAYESLLGGVGLVWDHYYFGSAVAAGLQDVGLCGVVAPTLQDLHGPGQGRLEQGLADTLQIAGDAGLARSGVFAALGPHATDSVSAELWARLAGLAQTHGLPLHFHLAQSPEEVLRVEARSGCSPVQLLERAGILAVEPQRVMAHGIYLSLADAARVTSPRGWLVSCPTSQTQFGLPARLGDWVDAHIPFLVASDSGNSNDGLAVQAELRFVAGFRVLSSSYAEGMSRLLASGAARDAAQAGSERARAVQQRRLLGDPDFLLRKLWDDAGLLHPACVAGALAPGALANLAIWNLDVPELWPATDPLRALCFSNLQHALRQLILMGRPQGEDGAFAGSVLQSRAYREALAEASRRLELLWRRAGC